MTVFITGGTGFVGSHLLKALVAAGHKPKVLVREGSKSKLSISNVELCSGDILRPETYASALKGCDAVINLVGIIREFPKKGITFQTLHFDATKILVDAASNAGVKRFIQMSANGADVNGVSAYETTKFAAEKYIIISHLEWTIFRPGIIFGDPLGKTEMVTELAEIIRKAPIVPIFGDGNYKLQPVAVEDVAKAFVNSLSQPETIGKTYRLCGPNVTTYKELIEIIGKALGKEHVKKMSVPLWLIKPFVAAMSRFSFFPITSDQLKLLIKGNVCENQSAWAELHIQPKPFSPEHLSYLSTEKQPPDTKQQEESKDEPSPTSPEALRRR